MIALALVLLMPAAVAEPPPSLAWLEGHWCSEPARSAVTCEQWGAMRGGMMLGTSQTVRDGKTIDFEFMRIEVAGASAVFHGSPRGEPAVAFEEIGREAKSLTFVNASHDYPQRIRYALDGATLIAEISLADGSKPRRWAYRRMP